MHSSNQHRMCMYTHWLYWGPIIFLTFNTPPPLRTHKNKQKKGPVCRVQWKCNFIILYWNKHSVYDEYHYTRCIEEKQLFALPQSESNSFELAFHKFVKLKSSAVEKKRATFSVGKEFIIIYYVSGIEWNLLQD